MSLQVAIQMDPIAGIDIRGDTTFALGLEAQRRGHEIFIYHPADLSMDMEKGRLPKDSVLATGQRTELIDQIGNHFKEGEKEQRRRELDALADVPRFSGALPHRDR